MSIIPPGISSNLQFYLSGPMPCPYLPTLVERKLFTRLNSDDSEINKATNAALCRSGFRRSHDVVYRPACNACNACIPVRIPTLLFKPSSSFKRTIHYNYDLIWQRTDLAFSDELFALFSAYQKNRHADSDMAHMTQQDFASMLQDGQASTHLYTLRDAQGVLWGSLLADPVGDGFSAVYSFYKTDEPRRSLGTFLILSLIAEAQKLNLPFIYLGYWVAESRKMAYKQRFKPLQFLGSNGWDWLE
jgi:arginine-tRNA-protein transferase